MSYAATKLARALITGWLAVTLVFVMLRLSGDPALQILGGDLPPETLDRFRQRLGLDRPIWTQYVAYWSDLVRGDFGQSFRDGRDVLTVVGDALPKTGLLMGTGFLIAVVIGIPAGIIAALRHGTGIDRSLMIGASIGFSVPNFFLAIVLILLFAMHWRILPAGGSSGALHLILPALTVGTYFAAMLARFARASMLDVLDRPFLDAARARGFSAGQVLRRHALPNAALPTITICGLIVGGLMGGAAVVETVFAWPGIGRLLVNAVAARDMPVVQLIVLLLAFTMVATNLVVDLLYGWIDPRLRTGPAGGGAR